jgi:hypothetical protein
MTDLGGRYKSLVWRVTGSGERRPPGSLVFLDHAEAARCLEQKTARPLTAEEIEVLDAPEPEPAPVEAKAPADDAGSAKKSKGGRGTPAMTAGGDAA